MPNSTYTPSFSLTQEEIEGNQSTAEFLRFLGEMGASCTIQTHPVMPNNIVSHNYVCITSCPPVVIQQIMEHYELHAVSIMSYTTPHSGFHAGLFVDTRYPKKEMNSNV